MAQKEKNIQELYQDWLSKPSPALCVRLASRLRRDNKNAEAFEVAEKGLGLWKDNISVNVIFGKCALDEKQIDSARRVFENVISIDPLNLIAIRSLAEIHFDKKSWSKSIELFEEYLFEYPGDPEIEDMLKKARLMKKDADKEARITGQNVSYPKTDRMASILASQGQADNLPENKQKVEKKDIPLVSSELSTGKVNIAPSGPREPRSLFNFFSAEECEDLGLKPYEK